jgi:predicted polyphosphate/ATP-dependent NAD kinase
MSEETRSIGIIANPSSGRDIRRLLARASSFSTPEKINLVLRLLGSLAALGLEEAWMLPDRVGIARSVRDTAEQERKHSPGKLPRVRLLEMAISDTVEDTWQAVALLRQKGVKAIAVLGGDGTHRAVARDCGDTPLATLSTGTNNAFPSPREATSTGLALGLFVAGRVPEQIALKRNKLLHVWHGERHEIALVDVAVTRQRFLGARAVWRPSDLSRLFVTFGQPHAIGLSAIAGFALPIGRYEPRGAQLVFGGERKLLVPLGPGLVEAVALESAAPLLPSERTVLPEEAGTIALDGEREIVFQSGEQVTVELDLGGPYTIDTEAILAYAAQHGLMWTQP